MGKMKNIDDEERWGTVPDNHNDGRKRNSGKKCEDGRDKPNQCRTAEKLEFDSLGGDRDFEQIRRPNEWV